MLGLNAAVENHIRKHQKKPTVAIESCSTLWPRINFAPLDDLESGFRRAMIVSAQQGMCQCRG